MTDIGNDFESLRLNDAQIYHACNCIGLNGLSEVDALKTAIIALTRGRYHLLEEVEKLRSIAPRRMRGRDGIIRRWDAADEFVPIQSDDSAGA